jgi:cytidylate kinase
VSGYRIIAIDGPAGSGKSTISRALAERLGLATLDTGASYRAVTAAALRADLDFANTEAIGELARTAVLSIDGAVVINGIDVTGEIREDAVNHHVSLVAANPLVRAAMVEWQQAWARSHQGGIVEGRDIGTVVFPDATVKLYLTASAEERARRRPEEGQASVERRDHLDSTRTHSPLTRASDALEIDTTELSVDEVVDRVLAAIERAEQGEPSGPAASEHHSLRDSPGRGAPFVPDPHRTLFYRFARRLVWVLAQIWFRPSRSGPGAVPETGAALIAPVHRSNLDFLFAIYATDRKIFFMAKDSLWKSKLLGRLLIILGAFPVHREAADRSALVHAEAVLAAGEVLVLFPEGTRREGPEVGEILEGAAFLSARGNAPVLPVGLAGTARAMPKGAKMIRPAKVHVRFGALIPAPERSGKGRVPRSAVHRQSEAIRAGIQAAYDAAQAETR